MRFGVCAGRDKAAMLRDAGYDYIELGAAAELDPDDPDDGAWAVRRASIEALPLPAETFNLFFRAGKVVGPDADAVRLEAYVHRAVRRAAEVGARILVFGSGGARRVPEDFPRAEAERQLRDFLGWCADAADKTDVVVAIEPLNRAESNSINTVGEGAALARAIGRPGVRNLADTYHMEKDDEPLSAIVESADVLAHTHTADSGRKAPGTGTYDHAAFFRTLRAAHYDARVSIECGWDDFGTQIGPALVHLKNAWEQAK